MKVLVTGGCGYIGSTLVPLLISKGHEVRVVDIGWFKDEWLSGFQQDYGGTYIKGDIRRPHKSWFEGMDAVIHLAAISNDPTAELYPDSNYSINAMGTALTAKMAKEYGVPKFILASTCSVYGFVESGIIKEEDRSAPKYPYGISKLMSEISCLSLMDTSFSVAILRKGTVGGYSPRMRYDLVVNTMTMSGIKDGVVTVKNASLWRPVVDVRDAARAYLAALESKDATGVFNILQGNYTIRQIGEQVCGTLKKLGYEVELTVYERFDLRNYKVSGDKALIGLGFSAERSITNTVADIALKIEDGTAGDFDSPKYYNIEVLKEVKGLR